jgi:hypothetical protein
VIDILVQPRRDQRAAERFFRRLLRNQGRKPFRIISDKLRSYSAARRAILSGAAHSTLCQQSHRGVPSIDSAKGAVQASLQISPPSATISLAPCCRPQSLPLGAPPVASHELSPLARTLVLHLANGDSCLAPLLRQATALKPNHQPPTQVDNARGRGNICAPQQTATLHWFKSSVT